MAKAEKTSMHATRFKLMPEEAAGAGEVKSH